ncbi:UDP-glucose 6-dehydrogenase TuaD [subsurface metagenome]
MKRFGVIGLGSVGWSIVHGLSKYFAYTHYDIEGDYNWKEILSSNILFICVSTPLGKGTKLDCSAVDSVLNRLNVDGYNGIIVIKSTLKVGFMKESRKRYPFLRITYMPEFLRERNCFSWFLNPSRIVISGYEEDISLVLSYFEWVKNTEILIVDDISAEIGKLAHNAFIATKVSFTNEIETICQENNAKSLDVMKIVWTDKRVKSSDHLTPGLGPYGGKCVPKDTIELINYQKFNFYLFYISKETFS